MNVVKCYQKQQAIKKQEEEKWKDVPEWKKNLLLKKTEHVSRMR